MSRGKGRRELPQDGKATGTRTDRGGGNLGRCNLKITSDRDLLDTSRAVMRERKRWKGKSRGEGRGQPQGRVPIRAI